VLDHLGETGAQLPLRQRRERVRVGEHELRLVERADHVLAARMVDRGLAAHRRVDLREQRRRHLDERHAALVGRGGEAGEVADHAAAERHDRGVPVAAVREQRSITRSSVAQSLCASPSGTTMRTHTTPAASSGPATCSR
jgi:hypothetical protein